MKIINNVQNKKLLEDYVPLEEINLNILPSGDYLCYVENDKGEFKYIIDHYTNRRELKDNNLAVEGWDTAYNSKFKIVSIKIIPKCSYENTSASNLVLDSLPKIIELDDPKWKNISFDNFSKDSNLPNTVFYLNFSIQNFSFHEGYFKYCEKIKIIMMNERIKVLPFDLSLAMEGRLDKVNYPNRIVKALSSELFMNEVKRCFIKYKNNLFKN